jgi:hypothetical protein
MIQIQIEHKVGESKYPTPKFVLFSPLRRALVTATKLFLKNDSKPKFVAIEALREKGTSFAADERSSVDTLTFQTYGDN